MVNGELVWGGKDSIALFLVLVEAFEITVSAFRWGGRGLLTCDISFGCTFLRFDSERWREREVRVLFLDNPPNISARLETKLFFPVDSEACVSLFSLSLSFKSYADLEI